MRLPTAVCRLRWHSDRRRGRGDERMGPCSSPRPLRRSGLPRHRLRGCQARPLRSPGSRPASAIQGLPEATRRANPTRHRAETAALCRGCVKCCTYIRVEVGAPRSPWEYDPWIRALHHRGVQLYVERPERWSPHFETRCAGLGADDRCAIHGRHPVMCREYDPRSGERWLPLVDIRAWFDTPAEFEDWIQSERPGHWARLKAWRKARSTAATGSQRRRTAVIPSRVSASTAQSG